jgi:hypothetical protein
VFAPTVHGGRLVAAGGSDDSSARLASACKEGSYHGPDPMAARPLLSRSRAAMKALIGVLIATTLAIAGCANSDRIEQTPLTVDVSGIWSGVVEGAGTDVSFDLEQHGSTVEGAMEGEAGEMRVAGGSTIVGIIAGDVFQFKNTRGDVQGELQISGDEMTGTMARVGPRAAATAGGGRVQSLSAASIHPLPRSRRPGEPVASRPALPRALLADRPLPAVAQGLGSSPGTRSPSRGHWRHGERSGRVSRGC